MFENNNKWLSYDEKELEKLENFNKKYINFISDCKTERECVSEAIKIAEKNGYIDLNAAIKENRTLKPFDKVYMDNYGKSLILVNIGKNGFDKNLNILGAHIDSPRIDIKQNPLSEDTEFAYLDTHYYGGIKKYQWVTMPLAIHGVFVKADGKKVEINIGENADDPVFCITDLLPHLGQEQMNKKASKVIEGEGLDLLVGSRPLNEKNKGKDKKEEKEKVKANIIKILKEKYDVDEKDFLSAELEVVPSGRARECGFDRSMVMGYGQDDRVCAYTSLMALLDVKKPDTTSVCLLVDKEEIGSVGATGMTSRFFENTIAEIMNLYGTYSELLLRRVLAGSNMISSDVNAAYDPLYPSVYEKKNSAYFGKGVGFCKFTGSGGKYSSNDANAEYIAKLRGVLDNNDITYQINELGKVDIGGGGTIAYILAKYGMNVIDCGIPVLSMHAPYEICSKSDIYETYKAYMAFLKEL